MKKNLKKLLKIILNIIVFSAISIPTVTAATVFLDDFENSNHDGWDITSTSGGGYDGVAFFTDSNWAYVYNHNSGKRSLSKEFNYQPDSLLSFDIHLLASTGRGNYGEILHTSSGVTVSFENMFNLNLGEVSFVYATSSSLFSNNSFSISNTPEFFEAQMFQWANLAQIAPEAVIANIGLEFWANGRTRQVPKGSAGIAQVRFDNVQLQVVPIPTSVCLLGVGLLGLLRLKKKF